MPRKSVLLVMALAILTSFLQTDSPAHFAMIIPSTDNVRGEDTNVLSLHVRFTHPFEGGPVMHMDKPRRFGVVVDGKSIDLLPSLTEKKIEGKSTWDTAYNIKRPGDYAFFLVPEPYWEPAEDKFIVHATKVIVDAFGAEEGWDRPIAGIAGLPAEIVPLTRPYSLYAGNIFTGRVFMNGEAVPHAEVEVEWWGKGKTKAPTDAHVTQVVKADQNGVFSFVMPKAGWWGFAALLEGPEKIARDGKEKGVEVGAVLWVRAYPMQ